MKKLTLHRETLRRLADSSLAKAPGRTDWARSDAFICPYTREPQHTCHGTLCGGTDPLP